ncbi:MAG: O-antigen ligase family protein [Acidobacteriota bacterium]|nr:O-antigen ligase family protein [Acidobacteriota bacterium]
MLISQISAVAAAQTIFWILLPCVLFAPVRWAVLVWLVMGNLDTTGPSSSVTEAVGWMNASKGILLPLYLWWRLRSSRDEGLPSAPANLWIVFVLYVAAASLWSPFPLAAMKLVGNLVGTFLTFVVVLKAGRSGLLEGREIIALVLASLGLGALQTFYYGGAAYGFDGADRPARFSSFVGAQQYGAFLVAFLAIALWYKAFNLRTRVWLAAISIVALVLNGSRTWFLGATLVLVVYLSLSFRRVLASVTLMAVGLGFGALLLVNFDSAGSDLLTDPSSRITATFGAMLTGQDTPQNIGLSNINFRLAIYRRVAEELRDASPVDLLFGHGTSSGGTVVMRVFPRSYIADTLDPNRSVHNEWLRVLYEWGMIGFILFLAILVSLVVELRQRPESSIGSIGSPAFFSFLPAFLLAFSSENLIASAGNAVTMSLALMVALHRSAPLRTPTRGTAPGSAVGSIRGQMLPLRRWRFSS